MANHKSVLWGDDIKVLQNLRSGGAQQLLRLAKGNGMSSVPMRGRLVKMRSLGLVFLDPETHEFSITDIGSRLLDRLGSEDTQRPGWNKKWSFLQSLL